MSYKHVPLDSYSNISPEQVEQPSSCESCELFPGRFAGGLINDLKRRAPFFCSDWTDAFLPENLQKSISTILYLFIAALAPAITYPGFNGQQFFSPLFLGLTTWKSFWNQVFTILEAVGL